MSKIKVYIKNIERIKDKDRNKLNVVDKVKVNFEVYGKKSKKKYTDTYVGIEINGGYDDDYHITNAVLSLVDSLNYYKEFNKFKNNQDVCDFLHMFGYGLNNPSECTGLDVVKNIKMIGKLIEKNKKIPYHDISVFVDAYSDGSVNKIKKAKKLLKKYFKIIKN